MSRTRWAAFTCAGLLLAASLHGDQPRPDAETQRLQGDWVIVAVDRDGAANSEQIGALLTFAGQDVRLVAVARWLHEMG